MQPAADFPKNKPLKKYSLGHRPLQVCETPSRLPQRTLEHQKRTRTHNTRGVRCARMDEGKAQHGEDNVTYDDAPLHVFRRHEGAGACVPSACFSPDGLVYAVACNTSLEGFVCLVDANTHAVLHAFGPLPFVTSVAFSRDGEYLVSGSTTGNACVWSLTQKLILIVLRGHRLRVSDAQFSPCGKYIVSASDDCTARVCMVNHGTLRVTLREHGRGVRSACFSPDGHFILTASMDMTVRLWNARSGTYVHVFEGFKDGVSAACFSADGRLILAGSYDGTVRVWETNSADLIHDFRCSDPPMSVCFSHGGQHIVAGMASTYRSFVEVWELEDRVVTKKLRGHTNAVCSVAFSPDDSCILTGSADGTVRLWAADTGLPPK